MEKISETVRIFPELYSSINKKWNRLITPSSALINAEDRRKSRLISSLILTAIIIFFIYIISFLFFDIYVLRSDFTGERLLYVVSDSISLFILIITFFISKSKYYYASSLIFLIICTGILIVNILIEDEIIFQIIFILALFSFLIIFTSLMYSTRTLMVGFLTYFALFLFITTIVKPQEVNVILIMGSFFVFQFLLTILQNHYYYRRVAELELAINEKNDANIRVEFLNSLLTHDMANKITRVNGYLFLMNKLNLNKEQEKHHDQIAATCKEGADLITKINHLRDLEDGLDYSLQEVNLNSILIQAVDLYKDQATASGIEILFTKETEAISVLGGDLLKELFSNLIENAIYHSGGKMLKISLSGTSEKTSVVIEDDGVGIPENITKNLFERGIKGDQSKGSGIGLFLVKSIANNLNANIGVTKSSLGGAKFILEFKQFKTL